MTTQTTRLPGATTTATWTKLKDGTWGVRANDIVRTGDQITVTTKAGKSDIKTVAAVLWTGIARDGREASLVTVESDRPARSSYRGRWTGCRCGSIEDSPRDSDCRQCQYDY